VSLIGNAISRLLQRDYEHDDAKSIKEKKQIRTKMGLIITHTGFILDYVSADKGQVLFEGVLACKLNPMEIFRCIKNMGYEECVRCAT
ncbi:MAG TPA: hypothetical protein PK120_05890, partial [Syntrophales bacterium]|nr:hypothetical protein [Syntrophales bacterium]